MLILAPQRLESWSCLPFAVMGRKHKSRHTLYQNFAIGPTRRRVWRALVGTEHYLRQNEAAREWKDQRCRTTDEEGWSRTSEERRSCLFGGSRTEREEAKNRSAKPNGIIGWDGTVQRHRASLQPTWGRSGWSSGGLETSLEAGEADSKRRFPISRDWHPPVCVPRHPYIAPRYRLLSASNLLDPRTKCRGYEGCPEARRRRPRPSGRRARETRGTVGRNPSRWVGNALMT